MKTTRQALYEAREHIRIVERELNRTRPPVKARRLELVRELNGALTNLKTAAINLGYE